MTPADLDPVAVYAHGLGFDIRKRTVLVEGITDANLIHLACRLEYERTRLDLLKDLCFIAAGVGDLGGTQGVIRELMCLRGLARGSLLPDGRPRYRFIALFDNDRAGKSAVQTATAFDRSILEFKDVFRLWPVMPVPTDLDPSSVRRRFERDNAPFKGLDWELEDLISGAFVDAFVQSLDTQVCRTTEISGKTHRDYSADGKARLHRFVRDNAMREDLSEVINMVRTLRHLLGLEKRRQPV